MSFSEVLELLKAGMMASRKGWNGRDLSVCIIEDHECIEPFFIIQSQTKTNTWVPSVSDILANDWEAFE